MRWVTVQTEVGPRACGVLGKEYVDVNAADPEMPSSVRELLALGHDWQRRAWDALARGVVRHDPANMTLLMPVPDPQKIICLGLELPRPRPPRPASAEIPSEPILFSKYNTTLVGHGAEIVIPEESHQVDYEAELVIVVGRGGRHIQAASTPCGTSPATRSATTSRPGTGN